MKVTVVSSNEIGNEDLKKLVADNLDCEELDISENPLSDISCLERLNSLRILDLHDTKVTNIEDLSNLRSTLISLNLADISMSDKSFQILNTLTALESLNLKRTPVGASLEHLSTLSNLTELNLTGVEAKDFTPLGNLVKLKELSLSESSVDNLEFLSKLKYLEVLDLSATKIYTLLPLICLPSLKKLYLLDTCLEPQVLWELKESLSLKEIIVDNDISMQAVIQQVLNYIEKKRASVEDVKYRLDEKNSEVNEYASIEIPNYFKCPITHDWIRDPIVAEDGHSYEREALITAYKANPISPITRQPISDPELLPINRNLKDTIENILLKKHPELKDKILLSSNIATNQGHTLTKNKIFYNALLNKPSFKPVVSNTSIYKYRTEIQFPVNPSIFFTNIAVQETWKQLFVAVYINDLEKVKTIVSKDKNSICYRDELGNNALLQTTIYGRKEIFNWFASSEAKELKLDEKELSLDVCNLKKHTPFLVAVCLGKFDFVKHLLEKYPTRDFLNERDISGKDAIQLADFYDYQEISGFLKEIRRKRIIDDLARNEGWNSLLMAIYFNDLESVKIIVKSDKKAIHHRDRLNINALLQAAAYGRIEIFDWLTSSEVMELELDEKELSLEVRNFEWHTPFLIAVYSGEFDFVKHLLEKYPTRNFLAEKDKFDRDAIQVADSYGHKVMCDFLKELRKKTLTAIPTKYSLQISRMDFPTKSANIVEDSVSSVTEPSLHSHSHVPEEDLALAAQEKWTPLFIAIYRGDLNKVKKIIMEDKHSICHRDRLGENALLLTAVYGRKEIFDWFTSPEARELKLDERELDLNVHNSEKHTPFLAAVYGGRLDFIKHLIDKYPNRREYFLNERDRFGKDAIQIADFYGHKSVANFLWKFKGRTTSSRDSGPSSLEVLSGLGKILIPESTENKQTNTSRIEMTDINIAPNSFPLLNVNLELKTKYSEGNLYQELYEATLKAGGEHAALNQAKLASFEENEYAIPVAQLVKIAQEFGFKCHDIKRDGNCFFHAVAHQLIQQKKLPSNLLGIAEEKLHIELRAFAVNHILRYMSFYQSYAGVDNWNALIEKISMPGNWADNLLCQALSRESKLTIVIVRSSGSEISIIRHPTPNATLYLGYIVDKHYQSLIKEVDIKNTKNINTQIEQAEIDANWTTIAKAQQVTLQSHNINSELFKKNQYGISQFFRDLDDSSDEDELEEKNLPIDYDASFNNFRESKLYQWNENRLFYLIHTMANRLQYSKPINQIYYKRKITLSYGETKDHPEETLIAIYKKICEKIISYFFDLLIAPSGQNILREGVNVFIISFLKNEEVNIRNGCQEFARNLFNNRHQLSGKLHEFFTSLAQATVLPALNIERRHKQYKFRPNRAFERLTPEEIKQIVKIDKEHIFDVALTSVKDWLRDDEKIPGKKEKKKRNRKPLISPLKKLAEGTKKLLSKARGGSTSRNQLDDSSAHYLLHLYIDDLTLNSEHIWIEIKTQSWLIKYLPLILPLLPLTPQNFDRFVVNMIEALTLNAINSYFLLHRPTLGNSVFFTSENPLDLLANLRLAHCSMRRESKNFQENSLAAKLFTGSQRKTLFYSWQFFRSNQFVALETQKMNARTLTRSTRVENAESYEAVYQQITDIIDFLSNSCNSAMIAQWIRKILKNTLMEDKTFKTIPEQTKNLILERLNAITYLLFGCEVARNPASIIIHQMMLDFLILNYSGISWQTLLNRHSPLMPMASEDSIDHARSVNVYCSKFPGMIFPYKFDDSKKSDFVGVLPLFAAEVKVIKQWLALKNIPENTSLNAIADTICSNFENWFGNDFKSVSFTLRPLKSEQKDDGLQNESKDNSLENKQHRTLFVTPQV